MNVLAFIFCQALGDVKVASLLLTVLCEGLHSLPLYLLLVTYRDAGAIVLTTGKFAFTLIN